MAWKAANSDYTSETGVIRKNWRDKIRIVLIYPNTYPIGMANLGFQTVYRLFNSYDHVVCERAFLPDEQTSSPPAIRSIESRRGIHEFDIVAFSVSFENDYPNLLKILEIGGLPLFSADRGEPFPLVLAGGVACFLNPEPVSAFIDGFIIGEAEAALPAFFDYYDPGLDRRACLSSLAQNAPGVYVPELYAVDYGSDGTISAFEPVADVPSGIRRVYVEDLSGVSTCSAIVTPDTTFGNSHLVEIGRGCIHGCRFCGAGFIYRPPRFRPISQLEKDIEAGAGVTENVGLVGAAVSDLPDIARLCDNIDANRVRLSFSSFRANALDDALISHLKKNGVKTATIAPDAGSQRMRNIINKKISEEEILDAAERLIFEGIPNLKLYFMIGLPWEEKQDVEDIVSLCKKIKHRFLKSSRARKKIGDITVSLNSFVPKPHTPFQWVAMDEQKQLKYKIKEIKNNLKKVANVKVYSDVPRWAYIQALLSRGDRRVGRILSLLMKNKGNWPQTLKESPVNPDFYVLRERSFDERFPWDMIDHGVRKSYLIEEYNRAKEARTTPSCRLEKCSICGACEKNFLDRTGKNSLFSV